MSQAVAALNAVDIAASSLPSQALERLDGYLGLLFARYEEDNARVRSTISAPADREAAYLQLEQKLDASIIAACDRALAESEGA